MTSANVLRLVVGDNPIPPNINDEKTSGFGGIGGFGVLIVLLIAATTIAVPILIKKKKCDMAFYASLVPAGIQLLAILLGLLGYFAVKNASKQ
jgi:hypothetical protein